MKTASVDAIRKERTLETQEKDASLRDAHLWELLFAFLRLGAISFGGGKGSPFIFDELVRRRRWVTQDDYAEAYTLAKLLPGPTGLSTVIFLIQRLRGSAVTLLCLVMYMAPGLLMMLSLVYLLMGTSLPDWAQGSISGLTLAATALLMTMAFTMVPSARRVKYGLLLSAVAFLGTCFIHVDLLLTIMVMIPLAMFLNRPGGNKND